MTNLFVKMENLVKRYVKDHKDDLDQDKRNMTGKSKYYFIIRPHGTVLIKEYDAMNYEFANTVINYYSDDKPENKRNNFYIINVETFKDGIPYGSIKKVKNFF